jgi:hypothetical protein
MLAMAGVLLSVRIRPAYAHAGGGVSEHGDCSTGVVVGRGRPCALGLLAVRVLGTKGP